jgi:SAM-dependent methyltransferase
MNYRERCLRQFEVAWDIHHTGSRQEYELPARHWARILPPFLPRDRAAAILDVGCGAGHFLYALQRLGYTNAVGIDQSEAMLNKARAMGITRVERADLFEFLPAHPDAFDRIVANDVIEHLHKEDVFRFLDAIRAALKPGGSVLIRTGNAGSFLAGRIRYIDFTHEVGFTETSLIAVLRLCGFEDVSVHGLGPVAFDLRSLVRVCLWRVLRFGLALCWTIQQGTGRGNRRQKPLFEPLMFAVARRPKDAR